MAWLDEIKKKLPPPPPMPRKGKGWLPPVPPKYTPPVKAPVPPKFTPPKPSTMPSIGASQKYIMAGGTVGESMRDKRYPGVAKRGQGGMDTIRKRNKGV